MSPPPAKGALLSTFIAHRQQQGAAAAVDGEGSCGVGVEELVGETYRRRGWPEEWARADAAALGAQEINNVEVLRAAVEEGYVYKVDGIMRRALTADGDEPRCG